MPWYEPEVCYNGTLSMDKHTPNSSCLFIYIGDSLQVHSLLSFGSAHEEGVEHADTLRQHRDLQLVLPLKQHKIGRNKNARGQDN